MDKVCTKCNETKTLDQFRKSKNTKDKLDPWCNDCSRAQSLAWANANKDRCRNRVLKAQYGISLEEYNELFQNQEGRCAICKKHQTELKRVMAVDHCHMTGKVRGLLCGPCNMGLGYFKESSVLLAVAKEYLDK